MRAKVRPLTPELAGQAAQGIESGGESSYKQFDMSPIARCIYAVLGHVALKVGHLKDKIMEVFP